MLIPVHSVSVALVADDLGRQELGRAADGVCLVVKALGEPKVSDAQVAVVVDQNVLRLEIAIRDIQVV